MKKICFLYVVAVLFSSKYSFAEEYKFKPDLSRNKPKTAPYSFTDKQDETKTVAKKVKVPKTNLAKHDWYADKAPSKGKNYFNFSLNAGYGKLDSTLLSNRSAMLNGQEIKISSTYTKTTNFSYGLQASYLRSVSNRFRVGGEINFINPNNTIKESQADNNGSLTKAKFNFSSGLSFVIEYDLIQYKDFSLFVNAGVGVAINSIDLVKEVPVRSTNGQMVTFTIKGKQVKTGVVGSSNSAYPYEACKVIWNNPSQSDYPEIAELKAQGYTELTNVSYVNNNLDPYQPDYSISPDRTTITFGTSGITCTGTAVSKKIGTEESTATKIVLSIPFNIGVGTYYAITDNILWTTRLNYYNMGNINASAMVDGVKIEAKYKTSGNVIFSSGITYRF